MDKRHGLEYLGLLGVLFADWELLGNGLGAFARLLLVNLAWRSLAGERERNKRKKLLEIVRRLCITVSEEGCSV